MKAIYKTAVSFYVQGSLNGDVIWLLHKESFAETDITTFFTDWKNDYGTQKDTLYSIGVFESARVRMAYIPSLYRALVENNVLVVKSPTGGEGDDLLSAYNVFELLGGVDNVEEHGSIMEFKVRRYQGK